MNVRNKPYIRDVALTETKILGIFFFISALILSTHLTVESIVKSFHPIPSLEISFGMIGFETLSVAFDRKGTLLSSISKYKVKPQSNYS